ncbi:hypothetical protein GGR57DRAFT_507527 [Xylariaceae sp. FL1272]|nr:hypothetical protein GGR57DRAFT_507527 [Xylariaceae sp. FL1272]
MDYYGNADRKRRCDDLIAMMNSSQLDMNRKQQTFEAKAEFYQDIVNRAARIKNYPTIEALEEDMLELMEATDREDVKQFQKASEGLSKMQTIVGSISLVSFASGVIGQVTMKAKYGTNILPWNRYNKANEVKVLKNFLVQHLTVGAPRELKVKRALGLISDAEFDSKMGDLAVAATLTKLTDAAEFSKGGKFANTPATLGAAKLLKRASRFISFLEVAGWVAEIAAIVTDVIIGSIMMDKLKVAIKELAAQRFLMKKLEMMGQVYDKFNEQVGIAIGTWVQIQEAVQTGKGDYLDGDTALNNALAEAYKGMEEDMIGVCDCKVLEACQGEDTTYGSWTNEDPSYKDIMTYLQDTYGGMTDTPSCSIHNPTPNDPAPSEDDYTEDPIYPTVLPASQVNASNCRYVELTEGKGCLWRIRGGFWTVQQSHEVNLSTDPPGLNLVRIQFLERRRTDTRIYLQNIMNWTYDKVITNWIPPTDSKLLLPWLVIDFSSLYLYQLPANTDVNNPGIPMVTWCHTDRTNIPAAVYLLGVSGHRT